MAIPTGSGEAPTAVSGSDADALNDAQGRAALARYRRRAIRLGATGIVSGLVGLALVALSPLSLPASDATGAGDRVVSYAFSFVVVMAVGGSLSLYRSRRMARLMRTSPWVSRPYRVSVDSFGNRRTAVVLVANGSAPEAVLVVSAFVWRVGELEEYDGKEILVAGDPSKVVVLRLPDSDSLFLARRPIIGWWRNRLRTAAMTKRSSRG